ncbi:DNA polymerase III subunit delta [Bacilliculturomica massiliensis]|uniref:DNA polymerase III subunit delta n=1 Tax=Bacilliculturomica massiliensis TaxID=1917867 RepID=UPI00102F79E4|nr:DNA polymerase III subunit delta [Bacilliculturomica massiliensis]
MAYQSAKAQEHAYQTFQKDLKGESLPNALFFYGREGFLAEWAVGALIKKYVNPAVMAMEYSHMDGKTVTIDELKNCCETLPMLSERKVVLVTDFPPLAGEKSKNFSEADEKELAEYIKKLPDTTLLLFTAETADRRRKLFKALTESGKVYDFCQLPEKQLVNFIMKRLKLAGKSARASAISAFIGQTGYYDKETDYTLYNVENDVKKAVSHSSGEEVTAEDFGATVAGNIDTNVFAMLDAVSRDRKEEAFLFLHNILDSGENTYKLLALVCSQFELMLSAKEMKEEGLPFSDIQKQLNVHEFRIKKALQFAQGYSVQKLRRVLRSAYEVDKNIKTGILEQRLALEMFVAEI